MKLEVPYYSQYLDVADPTWRPRACGVVCLKMLLESRGVKTSPLDEMIAQGVAIGAYGEFGWKHDGLIALAHQYGVKLSRAEWRHSEIKTPEDLGEEGIQFLINKLREGEAVAVSAIKDFREEKKFHMVVLVGFEEEGGSVVGFYYHDPDKQAREEGEYQFVSIEVFRSAWRKMAIF